MLKYKTFEEAVNFAIGREDEGAGFYALFARRVEKPATRSMFEALAAEERRHKSLLAGLRPEQLRGLKGRTDPSNDPGTSRATRFAPDMDFVDALRLAIEREEEAIQLYSGLRQEAEDATLKKLFADLVEQEQGHREKLQDEYDSVVLKDY